MVNLVTTSYSVVVAVSFPELLLVELETTTGAIDEELEDTADEVWLLKCCAKARDPKTVARARVENCIAIGQELELLLILDVFFHISLTLAISAQIRLFLYLFRTPHYASISARPLLLSWKY